MAFKETKKSGQYYRVFTGESNGVKSFDRYSFVTDASDVIFDDGTTAEDKFGGSGSIANINKEIEELKKSVSDGKKKVATAITDKGKATNSNASFQTMADNIRLMAGIQYGAGVTAADNRVNTGSNNYKSGYNSGYSEGYNQGYNNGQIQKTLKTVELYYNQETYDRHDNGEQNPLNALHSELWNGEDHRDWTYQFFGYTNKNMNIVCVETLELSWNNSAQWVTVGYYNPSTGEIRIDTNRSDAHDMRCRIYYY